jgi:hypothetical protein
MPRLRGRQSGGTHRRWPQYTGSTEVFSGVPAAWRDDIQATTQIEPEGSSRRARARCITLERVMSRNEPRRYRFPPLRRRPRAAGRTQRAPQATFLGARSEGRRGFQARAVPPDLLPSDILGVSIFNPRERATPVTGAIAACCSPTGTATPHDRRCSKRWGRPGEHRRQDSPLDQMFFVIGRSGRVPGFTCRRAMDSRCGFPWVTSARKPSSRSSPRRESATRWRR